MTCMQEHDAQRRPAVRQADRPRWLGRLVDHLLGDRTLKGARGDGGSPADAMPELAVLSVTAHAEDPEAVEIGQSALAAAANLEEERAKVLR